MSTPWSALCISMEFGGAASVRQCLWDKAEIYPEQRNSVLVLSPEQRRLLGLFKSSWALDLERSGHILAY